MAKKAHHEEHVDETWLIPYADMLTLLLALFIVMFAMSKVDEAKFKQMKAVFSVVFGGTGINNSGSGNTVLDLPFESGTDNTPGGATPLPTPPSSSTSSGGISNGMVEDTKMNAIKDSLEKDIQEKGFSDSVKLALNDKGLNISIQDNVMFNSGNANIVKDVYPLLMQISDLVRDLDNTIIVAGHTDNIPVRTAIYRSNMDLSAMRAINAMNYMIDVGKLKTENISIQAFGEHKPKYDNSTEEGRAKNRRVEIFIERKYQPNTPEAAAPAATTGEPAVSASPINEASPTHKASPSNEASPAVQVPTVEVPVVQLPSDTSKTH
jgi:chemotaxis protein MotB